MSFRPAKLRPGGDVPEIYERPVKAAEVWPVGALLKENTSGEWEECGADPTVIAAVALSGYGNSLAYGTLRLDGFPPGYCQAALVRRGLPFRAKYVGTLGTIGTSYGVVVDSDGDWKVDFSDTTNVSVKLVEIPAAENLGFPAEVIVVFLDAAAQQI